ncbi:MAG: hypothetical protein AAB343_00865 [Patescibacteria group bacterium]
MLYIIGGTSRSGKTLLARLLLKEKHIPYFPLDAMIGVFNALPEVDIDYDQPFIKRGEKSWRYIKPLFNYFHAEEENFLIEGDSLLPKYIAKFRDQHKNHVRTCFLGYTSLSSGDKLQLIRTFHRGNIDWTRHHSDESLISMIEHMITFSHYLQRECAKRKIPFFDISHDFKKVQKQIVTYLLKK